MKTNRVRRCDYRCHHAKGIKCKCWCHGSYHGIMTQDHSNQLSCEELNAVYNTKESRSGDCYKLIVD